MTVFFVQSVRLLSLSQITKQQLQTVKDRFQAFLNGETQIVADEAFINAVQSFYEVNFTLSVKCTSFTGPSLYSVQFNLLSYSISLKMAASKCLTKNHTRVALTDGALSKVHINSK